MNDKAWLESLKEGDEVYVAGAYGAVGTICPVARLTATQILVKEGEHEVRYRKEDGYIVGRDAWTRGHIAPVTSEKRAQIERMRMRTFINHVDWKIVTTKQLRAICAILKEGSK